MGAPGHSWQDTGMSGSAVEETVTPTASEAMVSIANDLLTAPTALAYV